jgi:hypothetical protein
LHNHPIKPAVFLDRDGTAEEVGYVIPASIFPYSARLLPLNDNNFLAIVLTNQSGVARILSRRDGQHDPPGLQHSLFTAHARLMRYHCAIIQLAPAALPSTAIAGSQNRE